jgi:DNA-binding transcriptional LysR family regulator
LDLRHLRYFTTVARTCNMSRAAAELRVAQPALSRQMRDLEHELGVTLLVRHAKGVTPTLAGDTFARGAAQTLADLDSALERAVATAAGRRGRVVLGAMRFAIAHGFLGQLEEMLRREHPEITIVLQALEYQEVLDGMASGDIDVAVTVLGETKATFRVEPLWVETVDHALLPSRHPVAARARLTVPDLGVLPLVLAHYGYPPAVLERGLTALRGSGLQSPILVLDTGIHSTHVAVAVGRGWTPLSRSFAATPPEGTTAVPLDGFELQERVVVVWRANERRPVIRTVLEAALDLARHDPACCVATDPPALPPVRKRVSRQRQPGAFPPSLEIRHLRALLGVAATQTIGRAAEQLGVTQPALSRQLKELEHATGLSLLDRSARGVMLTAAGCTLAGDCPALLLSIERLVQEARRSRRGMEGRCVIGAVATAVTSEVLTTALNDCAVRHPHVNVSIEEMASPLQLTALRRGEIDLGLAHAYIELEDHEGYRLQRIVEDRLQLALIGATHRLAQRRLLQPGDLADVPFLFMERAFHPLLYDRIMTALADIGLTPRIDGTHDGLHTVWSLAGQGKGWCLGFLSQRERPPLGTIGVPIAGLDLPWGIDILSREREAHPAVRVVVDSLKAAARHKTSADRGRIAAS